MRSKEFWLFVKKDIKEGFHIGDRDIILSILVGLSLVIAGLFQSTNRFNLINNNTVELYIPYIPIIIMIFAGVSIMQKLVYNEKNRKTLIPQLGIGITPRTIWLSKMVATLIITYLAAILSIILYLIILIFISGLYIPSISIIFKSLFISPLPPLVMIAFTGFIYLWFFNPWPVLFVFLLLPTLLFPFWHNLSISYNNPQTFLSIGVICLIIIAIIGLCVNFIPRYRLSGVLNREK